MYRSALIKAFLLLATTYALPLTFAAEEDSLMFCTQVDKTAKGNCIQPVEEITAQCWQDATPSDFDATKSIFRVWNEFNVQEYKYGYKDQAFHFMREASTTGKSSSNGDGDDDRRRKLDVCTTCDVNHQNFHEFYCCTYFSYCPGGESVCQSGGGSCGSTCGERFLREGARLSDFASEIEKTCGEELSKNCGTEYQCFFKTYDRSIEEMIEDSIGEW